MQQKTKSWTNPNPAIARNLDFGFTVDEITITDVTNGGQFYWNSSLPNAYVIDVDGGSTVTTNGVTPLSQSAIYGAAVSNFTTANPGVITATYISTVGIVAGDTIKVTDIAESGSGTSKNGTFTVASVTATAITLVESTVGYKTYVSGGYVTRVKDSNNVPIPTENFAIRGVTLGTSAVGANSASMVATGRSSESVT